jgi:lipopolysaccharide cholinephosphotransferase
VELSSEQLSKLKDRELGILIEFDKACKALGLRYTLSSGTLLGAVRHGGFIPWDDDVDVAMPRQDYERFIREAQAELLANLFVQTYLSDPKYPLGFCKIRDTSTTLKEYRTEDIAMKGGVYIDVFPIDGESPKKLGRVFDRLVITALQALKYSRSIKRTRDNSTNTQLIAAAILHLLARPWSVQTLNRIETTFKMRHGCGLDLFTYADSTLPPYRLRDSLLMPMAFFGEYGSIRFEGHRFAALQEREGYLRSVYGDYMTPPPAEQRVSTHEITELAMDR